MKIQKQPQQEGLRITLHGPEGVGKTTFGAAARSPLFVDLEDGTSYISPAPDVIREDNGDPIPWTWDRVLQALELAKGSDAKTIVIDTIDALEPLIWAHICTRDGQDNIEKYGYGKGYQIALVEWRKLLALLDTFRPLGKDVILLAHSWIKPFNDPAGDSFDRYELSLHKHAAGVIKQWSDFLLFAHFQQATRKDGLKRKGIGGTARMIATERCAAYDAKARHGMAPILPMSYDGFMTELRGDDLDKLRSEITVAAVKLEDPAITKWIEKNLTTASRARLAECANKLRIKLAEKEVD